MVKIRSLPSIPLLVAKVPQALQLSPSLLTTKLARSLFPSVSRETKWRDSFVGKRWHFPLFFRNLEFQAMHNKLAAADVGNPAEDEEHNGTSKT